MLPDAEHHRLVVDWNATDVPYPDRETVVSLFAAVVIGWGAVYLLYSKAAQVKGF